MKKVGIITFHWATNYGAVLQSFATQRWLFLHGYDVEIIDYKPFFVRVKDKISNLCHLNMNAFQKESKLKCFRKKYLITSQKSFASNAALKNKCGKYDAVICGSDQIWNKSFTLKAEIKPTLSYFLNFVPEGTKRIAYAASFGTNRVGEQYKSLVVPELKKFAGLSVRENTGLSILHDMGLDGITVPDPTALLEKCEYEKLTDDISPKEIGIYSYFLHGKSPSQSIIETVSKEVLSNYQDQTAILSIEEWLSCIRDSRMVLTNSFHGVMLSLIFNTPFISFSFEGSGMNNRIETILDVVGLSDRIVSMNDSESVRALCKKTIDWVDVNARLQEARSKGEHYLNDLLA